MTAVTGAAEPGFEDIRVAVADGIGEVIIARAPANNTVRPQTLAEICRALDALVQDPAVQVVVLSGEGRNFSAGADFSFLEDLTRTPTIDVKQQVYAHFQGAARRIYRCPKPTLAVVRGAAVTVGCELALACDFRICDDTAMFQEAWIRFGLMPPLGGLFLLPRLVGLGRAMDMCLRARAVKAEEALEMGLVSQVVAPDALDENGLTLARELAALAPTAYATIKEAIQRGLETGMEAEWTANVANQAVLMSGPDFREGIAAVKARMKPRPADER